LIRICFSISVISCNIQQKQAKTGAKSDVKSPELPFDLKNVEKGDTNSLQSLDEHLTTRSYIGGFEPTILDNTVFEVIKAQINPDLYPNLNRWHKHIQSFGNDRKKFPVKDLLVVFLHGMVPLLFNTFFRDSSISVSTNFALFLGNSLFLKTLSTCNLEKVPQL